MKSNQPSPAWPYLCLLCFLFVLAITAPRAWERCVNPRPLRQMLSARAVRPAAPYDWSWAERSPFVESHLSARAADPESIPLPPVPGVAEMAEFVGQPASRSPESASPGEPDVVALEADAAAAGDVPAPRPAVGAEVGGDPDKPLVEVAIRPTPRGGLPDLQLSEPAPAATRSPWQVAQRLRDELQRLTRSAASAAWARRVAEQLDALARLSPADRDERQAIFARLRTLSAEGERLAAELIAQQETLSGDVARAQHAVVRRLDVWENLAPPGRAVTAIPPAPSDPSARPTSSARGALLASLDEFDRVTGNRPGGAAWREYLLAPRLRELSARPDAAQEQRELARQLMARLRSDRLSAEQRRFVSQPPVASLQQQLQRWAAEPVVDDQLLERLERFEQSGLPSDAAQLAADLRHLRWGKTDRQALAAKLAEHYENANLRIAVSGRLVNRLLDQPALREEPVRDTIFGADVRGRSVTLADVEARLIPDPQRLRIGLEASGLVASDTAAQSGPARVYSEGASSFLVRKLLVVGPTGLTVWPAVANAENYYQGVKGVETDLDILPLIGSLARNLARSEHDDLRPAARRVVEQKLTARARAQFDEQVDPRLQQARQRYAEMVGARLDRLGLQVQTVALETTAQRLVARLRLAGEDQLGSHTPRPQAPSDSLLSVQLHESAINNALAQLGLDGRTFTLPELRAALAAKLGRQAAPPEELPEHVRIRFADRDAARVEVVDGRVDLVLAVAELTQREQHWRRFAVRARFHPQTEGRLPKLVRESGIYLEGESLRGKPQILLRTIFTKVLAKARSIPLVDDRLAADRRLDTLTLAQWVVHDGWLGLAFAERRPAINTARREK